MARPPKHTERPSTRFQEGHPTMFPGAATATQVRQRIVGLSGCSGRPDAKPGRSLRTRCGIFTRPRTLQWIPFIGAPQVVELRRRAWSQVIKDEGWFLRVAAHCQIYCDTSSNLRVTTLPKAQDCLQGPRKTLSNLFLYILNACRTQPTSTYTT